MTEPQDIAVVLATELAKQVPVKAVYDDGLAPGVKQAGSILEDFIKTFHLVLAPIQFTAALQDRYREFLDRSIRQVPDERRIAPAPQILGPVLEGIRYETTDTPIYEMFAELLSRSFDKSRVNEAHPAYPLLIKQLSPDEAILINFLLKFFLTKNRHPTCKFIRGANGHDKHEVLLQEIPLEDLTYPENLDFYFYHFQTLGLARKGVTEMSGSDVVIEYFELTEFGLAFAMAVTKQD